MKTVPPSRKERKLRVFHLHNHAGKVLKTITFSFHSLTNHLLLGFSHEAAFIFEMKDKLWG